MQEEFVWNSVPVLELSWGTMTWGSPSGAARATSVSTSLDFGGCSSLLKSLQGFNRQNAAQKGNKDNEPGMEVPLEQSHSRLEFNNLYRAAHVIRGGR